VQLARGAVHGSRTRFSRGPAVIGSVSRSARTGRKFVLSSGGRRGKNHDGGRAGGFNIGEGDSWFPKDLREAREVSAYHRGRKEETPLSQGIEKTKESGGPLCENTFIQAACQGEKKKSGGWKTFRDGAKRRGLS